MTKSTTQRPKDADLSLVPDASDFDTTLSAMDISAVSADAFHSSLHDTNEADSSQYFEGDSDIRESDHEEENEQPSSSVEDDPDALDNTTLTAMEISAVSTAASHSVLPDEVQNAEQLGDNFNTTIRIDHEEDEDQHFFSGDDDSEYHESAPSTPRHSADDSRNCRSDANISTPGQRVMERSYSNLNASDAESSGKFGSRLEISTPPPFPSYLHHQSRQQTIHLSYLSDASEIRDTIIKMESTEASTSQQGSVLPDTGVGQASGGRTEISTHSEGVDDNVGKFQSPEGLTETSTHCESVDNNTSDVTISERRTLTATHDQVVEHNNLFFLQDDGTVLAVQIDPTFGPQLLRAFSRPAGTLSQQSALPAATRPLATPSDEAAPSAATVSGSTSGTAPSAGRSRAITAKKASVSTAGSSGALDSTSVLVSRSGTMSTDAVTDRVFASTLDQTYDRAWMETYSVDEGILDTFTSRHKLDQLFRHGAVVVGDRVRVSYPAPRGAKEGEVLPGSTASNIQIRITPARDGFDGILRGIAGPKDLIQGMNQEFKALLGTAASPWKAVTLVSSSGEDFGTLYKVRQAYEVWATQKDAWTNRKASAAV